MRKWARLIIIIIVSTMLIIIGCERKESTKEEIYEDFHKKIMNISSYSCIAEIEVVGNKSPGNYTFIQNYEKPDIYKLEIILPESLKGNTIEYSQDNILIKSPDIGDEIVLPNENLDNQYLFVGDFISNYINNEEVQISMIDDYLVLKTLIPGESEYFDSEILYVDKDTKNPSKLEIIDEQGKIIFTVIYKDFEFKN